MSSGTERLALASRPAARIARPCASRPIQRLRKAQFSAVWARRFGSMVRRARPSVIAATIGLRSAGSSGSTSLIHPAVKVVQASVTPSMRAKLKVAAAKGSRCCTCWGKDWMTTPSRSPQAEKTSRCAPVAAMSGTSSEAVSCSEFSRACEMPGTGPTGALRCRLRQSLPISSAPISKPCGSSSGEPAMCR